jgi:hypothetical protein
MSFFTNQKNSIMYHQEGSKVRNFKVKKIKNQNIPTGDSKNYGI